MPQLEHPNWHIGPILQMRPSIIPILQKITLRDNGVPLKVRKLQVEYWTFLTFLDGVFLTY